MQWYVIKLRPGMEEEAARVLKEHVERESLQSYFGDILVPTEEVISTNRRKTQRRLFPGYMFLQMEMDEEKTAYQALRNMRDMASSFIGANVKPMPITEAEAKDLMSRLEGGEKMVKPSRTFEVGEMVRVISGPFSDFSGLVEEVNYDKNRLRVAVLIFGRSTPVELEFSQVEKN